MIHHVAASRMPRHETWGWLFGNHYQDSQNSIKRASTSYSLGIEPIFPARFRRHSDVKK